MNLKKMLDGLSVNADYISLRYVRSMDTQMVVRNEVLKDVLRGASEGVMVEVLKDGQFAYFASSDLSMSAVQGAAETALKMAQEGAAYSLYRFHEAQRPLVKGEYTSLRQMGYATFEPDQVSHTLLGLSKGLAVSSQIINREVIFNVSEIEVEMVATNGSHVFQNFLRSTLNIAAVASNGRVTQRRSWGKRQNMQIGLEVLAQDILGSKAQQMGEQALELLTAENCPTETMDLLLDSDQMSLQIHESIGHPLELDRILGDERNFAGWSFVKSSDFGKLRYGSDLLNITFDPMVPNETASYAFDDIGAEAKKEYIIQGGILQRGLGSLESQARLESVGVASQRANSWNRAPIDRMANLNLEPGSSSLEEMISSVEKGILMQTNRSWSIDDYRLKFQFGCEYAKLIEGGKITKTVKNPNYRGLTPKFWGGLKMVGDASTWQKGGTANCVKGEPNQSIYVGHAAPYCLFSDVEVFGG